MNLSNDNIRNLKRKGDNSIDPYGNHSDNEVSSKKFCMPSNQATFYNNTSNLLSSTISLASNNDISKYYDVEVMDFQSDDNMEKNEIESKSKSIILTTNNNGDVATCNIKKNDSVDSLDQDMVDVSMKEGRRAYEVDGISDGELADDEMD
uniref:Iwr1 domain-containing protein n=1 Tax=Parastrongyloides trichosuri TaxID=131310 RepID=A0A0N4ZB20_PARTI